MAEYNSKGQEMPDNTPVALPAGSRVPETLQQMIARMVQIHSVAAMKQELESFEEADDFDVEEDGELKSTHQMTQMEEELPRYKPSIIKSDRRTEKEKPPAEPKEKPPAEPAEPAAALKK